MKILIKCCVKNDLAFHTFKFNIYDLNNNLIISSKTDKYGCYTCDLPKKLYKIVIYSKNLIPNRMVGILNKEINTFCFIKNDSIVVTLTDSNYSGLKIGRGKIMLWQNHM